MIHLPEGYEPIPGGLHGGGRKPAPGGGFTYWYPSNDLATAAAEHHRSMAEREPHRAAEHHAIADGAEKDAEDNDGLYGNTEALHALHEHIQGQVAGSSERLAAAKAKHEAAIAAANAEYNRVHNHEANLHEAAQAVHDSLWDAAQDEHDAQHEGENGSVFHRPPNHEAWRAGRHALIQADDPHEEPDPEQAVESAQEFAKTFAALPVPPKKLNKGGRGRMVTTRMDRLAVRVAALAKGVKKGTKKTQQPTIGLRTTRARKASMDDLLARVQALAS